MEHSKLVEISDGNTSIDAEIIKDREDDLLYFAFIKHGVPIFEMDFHIEGMKYDTTLLAGFISAVSTFSKELSARGLERIDQGNLKVGFVESEKVSLFYLAGSISTELEAKLKLLFTQFESKYVVFLDEDFVCDHTLFEDFRPYVLRTLTESTVKRHYIPVMVSSKNDALTKFPSHVDIIDLIDDKKTVAEITMIINEEFSEVSKKLSLMKIEELIDFEIDVSKNDVFTLTPSGYKILFSSSMQRKQLITLFGEEIYEIIKSVDGTKSVIEIAQENKISVSKVQEVLSIILTREYVAHVPERIKATLVIDCIFRSLYRNLSKYINSRTALEMINSVLANNESVLINLIRFQKEQFCFSLVYNYLQNEEEIEASEIYEEFMDPLLTIFDYLSDIKSDKDLRLLAFEEANELYGVIF